MLRAIRLEGDRIRAGGLEACEPGATFWLDLSPDPEHLAWLSERFGFHPLALEDCAHLDQRPKFEDCISLQRLYVHEAIAEAFTDRFLAATARLKVGNPCDRDCDVGPMISEAEATRAEAWIRDATREGATVLAGGRRQGPVLEPTVLGSVRPDMKVVCQEAFAPLVCLLPYSDFDAALRELADTVYGLQAGVYTRKIPKALEAIRRLDFGGVMINDTPIFRVDHMPYGGNKRSGIGREGVRFAMEEMTNLRMVVIKP